MEQAESSAILVVDDDPAVLESTSRILSGLGYLVIPCGNVMDAMTKLQENSVCAVLTDIKMPGVTGLQFLEKIRTFNTDTGECRDIAFPSCQRTVAPGGAGRARGTASIAGFLSSATTCPSVPTNGAA